MNNTLTTTENINKKILVLRGQNVIIDSDIASIYGVPTKRLNEQVKRNIERFPNDFMFQLTDDEKRKVVAICDHLEYIKYSPYLPFVFTEHGALMAASVLNTEKAIQVSVFVMRAFIELRNLAFTHKELSQKFMELEKRVSSHDDSIMQLIDAIKCLMKTPEKPKRKIGFNRE